MKVGYTAMFQNPENQISDRKLYQEELRMAVRAESLGFDSVWGIEHHFTDYILSPHVPQFLTYVAAKTERVELGSAVVVLPWNDPIRVAEQISALDHMSNGRVIFGMGRGLARVEFDSFGVPLGDSRILFNERMEAILDALETGVMEYDGTLVKVPHSPIRPEPFKSFKGRTYAASISPETGAILAKAGVGLLIIAQKPWDQQLQELADYRAMYSEHTGGEVAPPPIVISHCVCAASEDEAEELAHRYIEGYYHTVIKHYEVESDQFGTARGYESYKAMQEALAQMGADGMAAFYKDLQVWGTPEQCLEKVVDLQAKTGCTHTSYAFGYAGMPYETANRSMELFASEVLPELQKLRD